MEEMRNNDETVGEITPDIVMQELAGVELTEEDIEFIVKRAQSLLDGEEENNVGAAVCHARVDRDAARELAATSGNTLVVGPDGVVAGSASSREEVEAIAQDELENRGHS
jgi:cell division ATPase FtsA